MSKTEKLLSVASGTQDRQELMYLFFKRVFKRAVSVSL